MIPCRQIEDSASGLVTGRFSLNFPVIAVDLVGEQAWQLIFQEWWSWSTKKRHLQFELGFTLSDF